MRRNVLIFILITLSILAFCIHMVWTLLTLLFVTGAEDAISRAEIPGPNSTAPLEKDTLIPKIIHQTYKNETIPEVWRDAQKSCLDLHPDYEYILWTDLSAREFIREEYPWFLETFDGYTYPIQRADAIRYFVLAHFGGIYLDLDDGCERRLDPLLAYPAWVRRTIPTGISNDAMGSRPQHPFFLMVIDELPKYDRSWLLPYITVMGSTGPLFLSVIWRHYKGGIMGREISEMDRVRVMFPSEYKEHDCFFNVVVGNSWHRWDVKVIMWVCYLLCHHARGSVAKYDVDGPPLDVSDRSGLLAGWLRAVLRLVGVWPACPKWRSKEPDVQEEVNADPPINR